MNLKKAWLVIPAAAALALTACAGGGSTSSSGSGDKVVTTNGSEPQNPLLPGLTNENGGGKILSVLFSQLVRYDTDGKAVLDVAESIEPNADASEWTIKLHNDRKFSDGTPVQAHNFIKAWNLITTKNQQQAAFFTIFEGTDDEGNGEPRPHPADLAVDEGEHCQTGEDQPRHGERVHAPGGQMRRRGCG